MDVNLKNMHYFRSLRVLTVYFFTLFASYATAQHSMLNRPITISIVNKRFDYAIKQIQDESKINLCYNSDIMPKNKLVTVRAYNNRLDRVLAPMLASVNLQMKEVNNQIIITKSSNMVPEETKVQVKSFNNTNVSQDKMEITGKIVTILDTIYYTVRDTIVKTIYDTIKITVYDTKVIRQMNKSAALWAPKFSIDLSCTMIYQISKGLEYSPNSEYHSFFEQYGGSVKNKHGYSIGSNFAVKNKRFELTLGVELFKLINNINSGDIPSYLDKIDSSIISTSIKPQGIFYTYKVDTLTLGVTYHPSGTTLTNNYTYVGFPVTLSYKIIQTSKIEIGVNLGIIYSRLISSKGFDANLSNGNTLIKNKDGESIAHENISFTAGFDIEYPLTINISLATFCKYRKNATSIYQKAFPMIEKSAYIYPGIAIKYKF